jgi:protein required for attachment to host cells
MKNTWVLTADDYSANFYKTNHNLKTLSHIKEVLFDDVRCSTNNFRDDRPGVFNIGKTEYQTASSGFYHGIKDLQRKFSKVVADYVNVSKDRDQFDTFFIVSPSNMLGVIQSKLSSRAKKSLINSYDKDPQEMTADEILSFLDFEANERRFSSDLLY